VESVKAIFSKASGRVTSRWTSWRLYFVYRRRDGARQDSTVA